MHGVVPKQRRLAQTSMAKFLLDVCSKTITRLKIKRLEVWDSSDDARAATAPIPIYPNVTFLDITDCAARLPLFLADMFPSLETFTFVHHTEGERTNEHAWAKLDHLKSLNKVNLSLATQHNFLARYDHLLSKISRYNINWLSSFGTLTSNPMFRPEIIEFDGFLPGGDDPNVAIDIDDDSGDSFGIPWATRLFSLDSLRSLTLTGALLLFCVLELPGSRPTCKNSSLGLSSRRAKPASTLLCFASLFLAL